MNRNILVDRLPTSVVIDEHRYEVNWDFRYMILLEESVLKSAKFDVMDALCLFYPVVPHNIKEATRELLRFYTGEKPVNAKQRAESRRRSAAVYSFEHDDELIYAAFLQQYGVDLQEVEKMHWHKFRALFHGLSGDCKIVEAMKYRGMRLEEIKDAETRKFYQRMKDLWEIPVSKSEKDKVKAVRAALRSGRSINEALGSEVSGNG